MVFRVTLLSPCVDAVQLGVLVLIKFRVVTLLEIKDGAHNFISIAINLSSKSSSKSYIH